MVSILQGAFYSEQGKKGKVLKPLRFEDFHGAASHEQMNRAANSLHTENDRTFSQRETAIEVARKDVELIMLGMDAPQDSAAYKMAQALIKEAQEQKDKEQSLAY